MKEDMTPNETNEGAELPEYSVKSSRTWLQLQAAMDRAFNFHRGR